MAIYAIKEGAKFLLKTGAKFLVKGNPGHA